MNGIPPGWVDRGQWIWCALANRNAAHSYALSVTGLLAAAAQKNSLAQKRLSNQACWNRFVPSLRLESGYYVLRFRVTTTARISPRTAIERH